MKILIVHDDEQIQQTLAQTLRHHGHDVATAANDQLALDRLHNEPHQLVICDWGSPQMNGPEFVRAVRTNVSCTDYIYLILLIDHDDMSQAIDGLAAGADDFVTKPFNPIELAMRVRVAERILTLESRDLIIFGMAKLAESRDPDTGTHLERVRNYSRILAHHLSTVPKFAHAVDSTFVRTIFLTSPLHDIGKVAIPDCVLLKPTGLSDDEFDIMKEHTAMGAATLQAALAEYPEASFLMMAKEIALTHHERYDGTGYPRQLRGEQIPLCGRIVALADVYDALTSKRVYKGSFSHAVARSIILEGRGTHFDPDVVDAFIRCESQFIDIQRRFVEPASQAA